MEKEKEKIGMEKLIELLNEYQNGKEKSEQAKEYEVYKWELDSRGGIARYDTDDPREGYNLYSDVTPSYLTSKSFGFIKWLVENDKIDTSKANDKNLNGYEIELRIRAVKELVADSEEKTVLYLNLLMLLSISDTPIEDLILYLK